MTGPAECAWTAETARDHQVSWQQVRRAGPTVPRRATVSVGGVVHDGPPKSLTLPQGLTRPGAREPSCGYPAVAAPREATRRVTAMIADQGGRFR